MAIENFQQLADYNRWANLRLYGAALDLPEQQYRRAIGVFFGSLHGTLNHLLVTDPHLDEAADRPRPSSEPPRCHPA